jgi:hypothetical protein
VASVAWGASAGPAAEASYRDVVRTWFYLNDILSWYPEFNQARNAVYRELGLIPGHDGGSRRLPASTGIGEDVSTKAARPSPRPSPMAPPFPEGRSSVNLTYP